MRRRILRKLARGWWSAWGTESADWSHAQSYYWRRLTYEPVHWELRPAFIRMLVDTAPSADDLPVIGTAFFEDWFRWEGTRAMKSFAAAGLSREELRACLSGAWPSVLREGAGAGMIIQLPEADVDWLLDVDERRSRAVNDAAN